MAPTVLIIGATGNTGRNTVRTLSELSKTSTALSGHRILALTRSLDNPEAKRLAALPGVEVVEQNWVDITSQWLLDNHVVRAFIAPHIQPNQFAEESAFHVAALKAGVKYVVRISTAAPNVRPDMESYYARAHWAIEALLSSPEFKSMHWTSLQPNSFSPLWLASAAEFIKQYRKTGEQDVLRLMASEDAAVGIIDPNDVGAVAAHLLAQEDTSVHNQAKYVLNGPEDISGRQIVEMVEQHIGTCVRDVSYKDMSFVNHIIATTIPDSKSLITSSKYGLVSIWEGKCTVATTSKTILELSPPQSKAADILKAMLGK